MLPVIIRKTIWFLDVIRKKFKTRYRVRICYVIDRIWSKSYCFCYQKPQEMCAPNSPRIVRKFCGLRFVEKFERTYNYSWIQWQLKDLLYHHLFELLLLHQRELSRKVVKLFLIAKPGGNPSIYEGAPATPWSAACQQQDSSNHLNEFFS